MTSSKKSKVNLDIWYLFYSHCLVRLNISSEYMTLPSIVFENFKKNSIEADLDVKYVNVPKYRHLNKLSMLTSLMLHTKSNEGAVDK